LNQNIIAETNVMRTEEETAFAQSITTSETRVIKDEPIITRENPIIYEKQIIHERPIIIVRTIIHSEQPIIIEKPELHERIINEQAAPIYKTENTIIRQEMGLIGEPMEGVPVVHTETEYIRDAAEFRRETPILHQKDVILEKPIIYEKDIIYREKPIIVEKPEVIETHIYETQAPVTQVHDAVFTKEQEFTTERPFMGKGTITHIEEPSIQVAEPIYKQEMPDIHETEVIHEKRLITEKSIVHTEKELIHERPEVHEKRIFHQEQTILQKLEPVLHHEGQANP